MGSAESDYTVAALYECVFCVGGNDPSRTMATDSHARPALPPFLAHEQEQITLVYNRLQSSSVHPPPPLCHAPSLRGAGALKTCTLYLNYELFTLISEPFSGLAEQLKVEIKQSNV